MRHFTQKELKEIATSCAEKLHNARDGVEYFSEPYRHIVIDNFLPEDVAKLCLESFPEIDDVSWEHENDVDIEVKHRTTWKSEFDIPEGIVDVIRVLNSSILLKAIGNRIGIQKLVPDAYFAGGGLNVTTRGGLLDVHVDGNYHDATGLNRRLNLLIYLNPGWEESWGGEFGVYDNQGQQCLKKVAPLFNRCVVFDSHDYSFHGLPNPINFPEDKPRRSIILYYYTLEKRPQNQIKVDEPHSALWVKRDLLDKRGNQTREYQ
jgi:hypothetical protein